jgi:hypothetical protein
MSASAPRSIAAILVLVVGIGCSNSRREGDLRSQAVREGTAAGPLIREIVYESIRPEKPLQAHVEVLIDSSASMQGFRTGLPPILHSVDEGLSYSKNLYFDVASKKTCFFNQKSGIFGCENRIDGVPIPVAAGYTNLDRAVQIASDRELTIILTDGVPSGLSTGQDCVGSGVDAGCVAEAMSGAVRGTPGASSNELRGVWMVPIITMYRGLFFAEQPVSPGSYDSRGAEAAVQGAFGVNARIENPHLGSDGTLLFNYSGPRFLLAIVIGDVEAGRAFLQQWYSHLSFSEIVRLGDAKSYEGGTALLSPFEVFPSSVPAEHFTGCQQTKDQRGRIKGDLINCSRLEENRFKLSCRPKPSLAELVITSQPQMEGLRLALLAPAKTTIHTRGNAQAVQGETGVADTALARLSIQASCGGERRMRCGVDESEVKVSSVPDLALAAREVTDSSSPAGQLLQHLSTRSPASEPHKVYGLADLLENFYRRKLPDSHHAIADLKLCEE